LDLFGGRVSNRTNWIRCTQSTSLFFLNANAGIPLQ
jgi:hypothetical protein